jgi:Cys-tRNA(Pro)/Cys-tRNA(Cys) deacylase
MSKKVTKTNAMRALEQKNIDYQCYYYDNSDNMIDGVTVAKMIDKSPDVVFKTIVTRSKSDIFVFVLPVNTALNLKKCAVAVNQKSIALIPIKEITALTGYIKGGCSPIGMKKTYTTVFDKLALLHDRIIFNAGKVGMQVEISSKDISRVLDVQFSDIGQ